MSSAPFVCGCCTRALRQTSRSRLFPSARQLSQSHSRSSESRTESRSATTTKPSPATSEPDPSHDASPSAPSTQSASSSSSDIQSAMSRRLEQATEDALLTGGRAGVRAVQDAGFSEELKAKLLSKISNASQFQSDHAAAFTEANVAGRLPSSAGQGTRAIASAQAWTGEEATEDTVLRMLNDARKPLAPGLRGKAKIPTPVLVDMRIKRNPTASASTRAANARDRAQAYAGMGLKEDSGLSKEEREKFREEFRERFRPGARAMPNSITGLAALANERIEDAIARGQFKNIPRGKGVERDARADNPFIDTTEYIMNKMIKRQEIVPPWIEKQQELVKTANSFRATIRANWKRNAARMISSRGGSLEEQMARAREYARAEEVHNPRRRNVEQIAVPTNSTDDAVMVKIRQKPVSSDPQTSAADDAPSSVEVPDSEPTLSRPFRDPDWEARERSYMELAISNLNAITRSYNLMAPELAKKPYFSLERELNNCFADIAPQLAETIKDRAARPPKTHANFGGRQSPGILERFAGDGKSVRVYESKDPQYGLKEMWRDFWKKTPSQ